MDCAIVKIIFALRIIFIKAANLSGEKNRQNSLHTGLGKAYPFCPENLTPSVGLMKDIASSHFFLRRLFDIL